METAPNEALAASAADDVQDPPRAGRALLALAAAATIAAAPVARVAIPPGGSAEGAHSIPAYLFARLSHDVGHNGWAFAGNDDALVEWALCYLALGLFWLVATLWMRRREQSGRGAKKTKKLWWRALLVAWGTEAVLGCLTIGAGLLAAWNSWPPDTFVLHAADFCSPWWSFVAVACVVGRAERSVTVLGAGLCYGVLLASILLAPIPLPALLQALILALPAAVAAVMTTPHTDSDVGAGAGAGAGASAGTGAPTGRVITAAPRLREI